MFLTVTGLTVQDFHLLVQLKVFNTEQMNQAVFAFRRYEDASLASKATWDCRTMGCMTLWSRATDNKRRILRKIAANEFENLGDISTLANPDVVQVLIVARVIRESVAQ